MPLLTCVTPEVGAYIFKEIHEGICGNHFGLRSLVHKTLCHGYYWPTIMKDA